MDATKMISVSAIVISIAALLVSYLSYRRSVLMDTMRSYFELERDSDNSVYALLIGNDHLNKLFYERPKSNPPDPTIAPEDMSQEDRAVLNFAELVLDYFEQLVLLDRFGMLPKGIKRTWEPWVETSLRAPYFVWAWKKLSEKYHPELQKMINRQAENREL